MSIKISDLTFVYNKGTILEKLALREINLNIENGECVAVVGPDGSGKSTLLYLIKNLLRPSKGKIELQNSSKIGLLFQNPYHQLFEETVFEDVGFSLKKLNLSFEEKEKKVRDALKKVGMNYYKIKDKSPFSLSFGEMKKVALAGLLVSDFDVLTLDEPTTSLDYKGKKILEEVIKELKEKKTILIISSSTLEDVFSFAERIIILKDGKIILDGTQRELIEKRGILCEIDFELPLFTQVLLELKKYKHLKLDVKTIDEAKEEILKCLLR